MGPVNQEEFLIFPLELLLLNFSNIPLEQHLGLKVTKGNPRAEILRDSADGSREAAPGHCPEGEQKMGQHGGPSLTLSYP